MAYVLNIRAMLKTGKYNPGVRWYHSPFEFKNLDFQNPMGILRPSTKQLGENILILNILLPTHLLSHLPSHSLDSSLLLLRLTPSLLCSLWGTQFLIYFILWHYLLWLLCSNFALLSLKYVIRTSPFLEKQLKKVFFSPREEHQNTLSPFFIKETF